MKLELHVKPGKRKLNTVNLYSLLTSSCKRKVYQSEIVQSQYIHGAIWVLPSALISSAKRDAWLDLQVGNERCKSSLPAFLWAATTARPPRVLSHGALQPSSCHTGASSIGDTGPNLLLFTTTCQISAPSPLPDPAHVG